MARYAPNNPGPNPAVCATAHNVGSAIGGNGGSNPATQGYKTTADYIMHHEPFQYYASTANPHHIAPASLAAIGTDTSTPGNFDTANHQYDTSDFDNLVSAIGHGTLAPSHLPAVSYLKAPAYQDGHAGYSDPLDEQTFIAQKINALEQLPTWSSTAVVVAYDDSDGWYDHVYSGVHNPSNTSSDALTGASQCGTGTPLASEQGRCGYGPRLPMVVISPWAKANFIDHTLTDQSSLLKFIEDNWLGGQRIAGSFDTTAGSINTMFNFAGAGTNPILYLDPTTGQPTATPIPIVPETGRPVLLVVSAGLLALLGFGFVGMKRRRQIA
jgi:phospholipase C